MSGLLTLALNLPGRASAMVLKKAARTPPKHYDRSAKLTKPLAAPATPPAGLEQALAHIRASKSQPAGLVRGGALAEPLRGCLAALGDREQPKRFAAMPIEAADALIDAHAKRMADKCVKCANLLRSKYALLAAYLASRANKPAASAPVAPAAKVPTYSAHSNDSTDSPWLDDDKTIVTFMVDGVPKKYRIVQ